MKRLFTLLGSIVSIVGNFLFAILLGIDCYFIAEATRIIDMVIGLIIVYVIFMVICITSAILSILIAKIANKEHEVYKKKFSTILATTIINSIVSIFVFVNLFLARNVLGIILYLLVFSAILCSVLFFIIDLCLENKRQVKDTEPKLQNGKQPVIEDYDNNSVIEENKSTEQFENKIEKLNSMKEKGLISEEEYQELKSEYIKQMLNK